MPDLNEVLVGRLASAKPRWSLRQTALFYKTDSEYGRRVAEGLGLDLKEVARLVGMRPEDRAEATAQGT